MIILRKLSKNITMDYDYYDYYVMVHAPRAKIMGVLSVSLGTCQVLRAQEMLVQQTRREELETQRFQLEESMKVLSHKVATQSDRWLRCIQTWKGQVRSILCNSNIMHRPRGLPGKIEDSLSSNMRREMAENTAYTQCFLLSDSEFSGF